MDLDVVEAGYVAALVVDSIDLIRVIGRSWQLMLDIVVETLLPVLRQICSPYTDRLTDVCDNTDTANICLYFSCLYAYVPMATRTDLTLISRI